MWMFALADEGDAAGQLTCPYQVLQWPPSEQIAPPFGDDRHGEFADSTFDMHGPRAGPDI